MKVADVRTFIVDNTPPYHGGRRWLFVKLVTDDGLEGIGEWSTAHIGREEAQARLVEALAREFVVGANPFDVELLWQRMYATHHDFRHPGLDSTPAIGAIEIACWDIVGKALNQPVYNLRGADTTLNCAPMPTCPPRGSGKRPRKRAGSLPDCLPRGIPPASWTRLPPYSPSRVTFR